MNKEFIEAAQESEWESIQKILATGEPEELKKRIDTETKLRLDLCDICYDETKKNKRLKVLGIVGGAAAAALTGIIFYKRGKIKGIKAVNDALAANKVLYNPNYELYKEGICAFIDDSTGHFISTIETDKLESFKDLSEEAYNYFKETMNMLSAGND